MAKVGKSQSGWILALPGLLLLVNTLFDNHIKDNHVIEWDVQEYYMYLPALLIHHDGGFDFVKTLPDTISKYYWLHPTGNGKQMGRMTLGMAIAYLPFFLTAHAVAILGGFSTEGFSAPYQKAIGFTGLVWVMFGLYFLRKLLLRFFSVKISNITVVAILLGTNLWYYSTSEGAMTHATLFGLLSIYIYYTVKWHERPQMKSIITVALTLGLAVLIRPTSLLASLVFVLYNVQDGLTLRLKLRQYKEYAWQLAVGVGCMILIALIQMTYWKVYTGQFIFYSYVGERFFFNHPVIGRGLLGFRKGWLIYTPLMSMALIGIFALWYNLRSFFWPVLVFVVLNTYVVLSWWCWWYGGGFGLRAFIESYALLALPLAALLHWISGRKWMQMAAGVFICCCIVLNIFQSIQYQNAIIHYDSMTKEAWLDVFGKMDRPPDSALQPPDYEAAKKGER
jgi:hypothetical protein